MSAGKAIWLAAALLATGACGGDDGAADGDAGGGRDGSDAFDAGTRLDAGVVAGDAGAADAGCRTDQEQVGDACACAEAHHERAGTCVPDVERHPGHWVLLSDLESIRVPWGAAPAERYDLEGLDEVAASSDQITGVLVRFFWSDLATGEGVFRFDRIVEHLERLEAIGAAGGPHLVYAPMITWRSYRAEDHPMPAHLSHLEEPVIGASGAVTGHRGQVWKPATRARYRELLEALAAAVGDHPRFAGVGTQETAVGPPPLDGYTPSLHQEALIDIGVMHREVFPRQEIFFMFNFLSADASDCDGLDRATECGSWPPYLSQCAPCLLGEVLATLHEHEIALGGPDILPGNGPLETHVYPHYPWLHEAGARLYCHAQKDSYRVPDGSGGFLPMQEIFEFARDQLFVDYVFWFHKETEHGQRYDAAVPVIDANPYPWR